ncbi:MAG: PAS domain S-box protein [Candidatus Methanofastidiosa archaeon]|nr:PAS domain S-box protein [Candidatus Methanofastidiosa archaeon]
MQKRISILHVEDDAYYSRMFQIHLDRIAKDKAAYELFFDTVPSTAMAYDKICENNYDCIISDYQIISGNGLDVLRFVRDGGMEMPFIFLTGQGDERVAREAFVLGANDYFTKDITIADYERIYNSIKNQVEHFETRKMEREHEVRYRTIFENTNAALILVEEDTTISLMNREFEKMSGYGKEEVEGRMSWTEFVIKDEVERLRRYHRDRRQDGKSAPNVYYFHMMDKSGDEKYIYMSVAMIPGTRRSLASMIDLTEQKKALSALEESEMKYRALFKNSRDGIWTATKDGYIIDINNAALDILGYTYEEIIGMNADSLFISQDDIIRFVSEVEKYSYVKDYEVKLKKRDGTEMDCLFTSTLWQDANGETIGYQGILRDVTERNVAVKMLRRRISELSCIHEIALLSNSGVPIEAKCAKIVSLIASSLSCPESVSVMMTFDGTAYRSDNFLDSACRLREDMDTDGFSCAIEAHYHGEWPGAGPILDGERQHLKALTNLISALFSKSV